MSSPQSPPASLPNPIPFTDLPVSLPAQVEQLTEATSRQLVQRIRFCSLTTPLRPEPIATAYVPPSPNPNPDPAAPASEAAAPPLLLLHGFDSSLLEFRRLYPLLAAQREVWLVDLLGFGFGDRPRDIPFSPASIQQHLRAFWQQQLGARPVVLVGASMGGAAAIDLATALPEAVAQLVLLDSAGYRNGPILGKYLVSPLDQWAVEFLRRPGVRRSISRNAYADPERLVTADAQCCAALHLEMPGWDRALKAFSKSGGYPCLRSRLPQIQAPTLVLWGRQDRILGTRDAVPLAAAIPQSQLQWIENSGHVPHLEQPQTVAEAILAFASSQEDAQA